MSQTIANPPSERLIVLLLASSQALFLIAAITVMTLSGVVGRGLAPSPTLATLPVALMMLGTVTVTLPASLLMKRIGRRAGFLIGTIGGGVGGGAMAAFGVMTGSFLLFCLGNLLLGVYQAFAMYYRFARRRCGERQLPLQSDLAGSGGRRGGGLSGAVERELRPGAHRGRAAGGTLCDRYRPVGDGHGPRRAGCASRRRPSRRAARSGRCARLPRARAFRWR